MTTQINLKFQDDFYKLAKNFADSQGFMSVQELVRQALREKIFDEMEFSEEYKKILDSKEANTFSSVEDSKKIMDKLRQKAGM